MCKYLELYDEEHIIISKPKVYQQIKQEPKNMAEQGSYSSSYIFFLFYACQARIFW